MVIALAAFGYANKHGKKIGYTLLDIANSA
jgi:hypothetical protein